MNVYCRWLSLFLLTVTVSTVSGERSIERVREGTGRIWRWVRYTYEADTRASIVVGTYRYHIHMIKDVMTVIPIDSRLASGVRMKKTRPLCFWYNH